MKNVHFDNVLQLTLKNDPKGKHFKNDIYLKRTLFVICKIKDTFIIMLILVKYSYKFYFFIAKDGNDKIKRKPSISHPKKCLKCNKLDCTFADCDEFNYNVCLLVRNLNRHSSSLTFNFKDSVFNIYFGWQKYLIFAMQGFSRDCKYSHCGKMHYNIIVVKTYVYK